MSRIQLFKRILLPCAAGIAAESHTHNENSNNKSEAEIKPSELPIYSKQCSVCREERPPCPPNSMEEAVGNIRRELWVWQDNLRGYRHKIIDVYRKGFSRADSLIAYLREENHAPQRAAAIGVGGLTGYILGLRKGRFRRFLYTCFGAITLASICYPNEAIDILEALVLEARRDFIVVYHFICGETPTMPGWLEKYMGQTNIAEKKSGKNLTVDPQEIKVTEQKKEK